MQLVYFNDSSRLWDWINDNYSNTLYVAPSPAKADGLRSRLQAQGINTDVLTINKFLSELIKEKNLEINLKRKSELYLIFGWLKSAYLPELSYEQFANAYTLFSELRSFSLDLVALAPILEEQDPQIKKAIEFFWNILEQTQYHDEHSAYAELTQSLRGEFLNDKRTHYIFWGFQHLNGLQVDFLKALSIRNDVIVPFPFALKEKLKNTDWPSWLLDISQDAGCIDEENPHPLTIRWRKTNSRELALQLKNEIRGDDQVVLGVSKVADEHLHLLPFGETRFKIPHQLINQDITSYFNKLTPMSLDELQIKLKENSKVAVANQDFKQLKLLQLIEEALLFMGEITDARPELDQFLIYVLKEVVSLNQPRTSFTSLNREGHGVELKSFNELDSIVTDRRVIFCIDDRFGDLISLGQRYSVELMSKLSILGPLKRAELDLEFKKWELREIIKHDKSLLLMPEDVLKHSLSWSKILEGIEIISEDSSLTRVERKVQDYFNLRDYKHFEGGFSASKIKSYNECPRKFYFSFVEKFFPDVVLTTEIDPRVKGSLSHKIIETAVKENLSDISELTKTILDEQIKDLSLKEEEYQNNLIQLTLRSQNGLDVLKKIEEVLVVKPQWQMEDSFAFYLDAPFKGQIDCYALVDDYLILLDFKSTRSAAPSITAIRNFEDLQLWIYLLALRNKGVDVLNKNIIAGYVVLDEPSESVLLFSDDELSKTFKEFYSANPFKMDLTESLVALEDKLNEAVSIIKSDSKYLAQPKDTNACVFCELNRICMKGSVV